MNVISPQNRSGRWALLLVAAVLLLGVAAVAAQSQGPDPNAESDQAEAGAAAPNSLSADEMVGRSPNEAGLQIAAAPAAPNDLYAEAMAGQSPNESGLEAALAPGAANPMPLEEMVGRSPNGDEAAQDSDEEAQAEPAVPDAPAAVSAAGGLRFLITTAIVTGANADSSCLAGYHMANLFEVLDTTNLTYASIPGAKLRTDMGGGPVAGWWGWVRTGNDTYVANVAGRANCNNWSSSTPGDYGTLVRLAENWTASAVAVSPWQAQTWSCGGTAPVWCVEN